jgi:hypothetical protein
MNNKISVISNPHQIVVNSSSHLKIQKNIKIKRQSEIINEDTYVDFSFLKDLNTTN